MIAAFRLSIIPTMLLIGACVAKESVCVKPDVSWINENQGIATAHRAIDIIRIDGNGALYWNGERTIWVTFSSHLRTNETMVPQPLTVFRPDAGAPCAEVRRVRSEMSHILECREQNACGERPEWSDAKHRGFDI